MPKSALLGIAAESQTLILERLHTSLSGLSLQQVRFLQKEHGANRVTAQSTQWWQILFRQVNSPFIYVLLAAAVLASLLGEFVDGGFIFLFVIINTVLGFFQEFRSEQALRVLQKYTQQQARVVRDGTEHMVETAQLVPGDILLLEPGDIIPADARLLSTHHLLVDESSLSGESVPVEKNDAQMKEAPTQLFEVDNIVFSGTSVLRGSAQAVVVAIGKSTHMGEIAQLTVQTSHQSSFEKGMHRFSSFVLKLVVITLVFLFVGNLLIKPESDIPNLVLFSIALAAAVIPEALPLVITFSLSKGALKLAKHKVVVKRLSAIEDLGGIEVLCTDKTGTITKNIMTVHSVFAQGGPGHDDQVYLAAALGVPTSARKADPFDTAILDKLREQKLVMPEVERLASLPFDPGRRRNSVLLEDTQTHRRTLIIRGAIEAILPFCQNVSRTQLKYLDAWAEEQGLAGRRVIAVARRNIQRKSIVEHTQEMEEKHLDFVGCLSFVDPLKASTSAALRKAKALGVQVKILTGDGPVVAGAVAQQVGLVTDSLEVITGVEFEALSLKQQHQAVRKYHVFARVSPQQKFTIIELLKEKFEVGYLGEGINDAPALKAANVSLAVQGASEIAKETADVILLNASLQVIIDGIQEGRAVFANTIKYVRLTMASNFGNFFATAIASFLITFLPMLPIQILLVNLLTDFPLIAVATDAVDPHETAKPERYDMREFALSAMVLGAVSSLFDFMYFGFFYRISPEVLQTNWFIGSVLCELLLFFSLRTKLPFFRSVSPSKFVTVMTIGMCILAVIIPFTALGQGVFSFVTPQPEHLVLTLSLAFAYFVTNEVVKLLYYRTFEVNKTSL